MRKWAEVFGALPTSVTLPNATRMDTDMDGAVVFGQYQQAIQRGNTKAAYFIAGLKGELEENININNVTPQVVVDNEMTAEKLAKIMSREDVHNEGVQ